MVDGLEVITRINELYSSALSQIITFTLGLLAFVGILLPIAISYLQNRQFKRDHEAIRSLIQCEVATAKLNLEENLESLVNEKMQAETIALKSKLEGFGFQVSGRVNHNQARSCFKDNLFIESLNAGIWAANDYIKSKHEANLVLILAFIPDVLKSLNKESFQIDPEIETRLTDLFNNLEPLNGNGRYTRDINMVKSALRLAKVR